MAPGVLTEPALRLGLGGLLVAGALALAVLALRSLVRRDRRDHGPTLRRFARALGVPASERRLLRRMAHRAGVAVPAAALLSRGCFDSVTRGVEPASPEGRRLAAIRCRVFE